MNLSIITINYNNLLGLRKTVESVLSQTHHDFEYIIIDGDSTDGSKEYLQTLPQSHGNLHIVSEPDAGIYNAMNKGIRLAHGEYCLFLNSGDFLISPDVIKQVFDNDIWADILCAKCNISNNGEVVWVSNPPQNVTFATLYFSGLSHQSTFIRRTLLIDLGMYDESFRYHADIDFWYRSIILHNATTQRIDVITTDYNLDGLSSTQTENPVFKEEHKRIKANPLFAKFIPDYDQWRCEKEIVNEYAWINAHPVLRKCLNIIHRVLKHCK